MCWGDSVSFQGVFRRQRPSWILEDPPSEKGYHTDPLLGIFQKVHPGYQGTRYSCTFPRGGGYLSGGGSTGILSAVGIITRTSWLIPLACHTTRGTPSASGTGSILNDSRMQVPDRQIVPARCEYRIRRVTIRTNRSRILSLKSRRY